MQEIFMLPGVDLESFIRTVGYVGMFAIIFAETGLLVGFFLPGDSLLFTAGFLASQGYLDISLLLLVCFVAAVTGDATGYAIGRRYGRRLFEREDSKLFKKEYLLRAEQFFAQHGGKAVILARFIPIVRTFVPVVTGMGSMEYRRFAMFNVVGALLWAVGVTLAGYFLGSTIPNIDRYLLPIIFLILVVSILPPAIHIWRENGDQIKAFVRTKLAERKARS
jgi:membrane-associated protein